VQQTAAKVPRLKYLVSVLSIRNGQLIKQGRPPGNLGDNQVRVLCSPSLFGWGSLPLSGLHLRVRQLLLAALRIWFRRVLFLSDFYSSSHASPLHFYYFHNILALLLCFCEIYCNKNRHKNINVGASPFPLSEWGLWGMCVLVHIIYSVCPPVDLS